MRRHVIDVALFAILPVAPALALERVLPAPRIKDNGDVRLADDLKIGRFRGGQYTATPNSLDMQGGTVNRSFSGTFTLDTRTYADPQRTNGPYTNYDTRGNSIELVTNTEAALQVGDGLMRDSKVFLTRDLDTKNYEASGYRAITNGLRSYAFGHFDNGVAATQWKDIHGGWFYAMGRSGGIDRGMSGILAEAVQLGTGVATNEFSASSPIYASEEANLLAPVIGIVYNHKADVIGTRRAYGLATTLTGYKSTAAFRAASLTAVGQPGASRFGIQLDELTVTEAGITMPQSIGSNPNAGTVISYGSNQYSFYDRQNKAFSWIIDGTTTAVFANSIVQLNLAAIPSFATDAAADASGTIVSGQVYRIDRALRIKP